MKQPTVGLWQALRRDNLRGAGSGGNLTEQNAGELAQNKLDFPSFVGGLNYQAAEQDQPLEFTQETYDVVVTDRNRLKRAPGHSVALDLAPLAPPVALFVHPSLDFSAELVLLAPPSIYIVDEDNVIDDANITLPDSLFWVGLTNGEDFLFSDGETGIWKRAYGAAAGATLITNAPGARTMANFAGRVLVGGVTLAGSYEALGIMWSGASGSSSAWTGLGVGAELLISNNVVDDRVIALRPMSFDLCGILCQKSIWVGLRTGNAYRPVDFQPRAFGIGCVAEPTAQLTPMGLMFLGEAGVHVFDGNSPQLISAAINDELLPVMMGSLRQYSAVYDSLESRYILFTPTHTWIYELQHNRWLRYSFQMTRAVAYSEQLTGVTWETVDATWAGIEGAWQDLIPPIGKQRVMFLNGTKIGFESFQADEYLDGTEVVAKYGFLRKDTPHINSLFTTQRIFARYKGEAIVDIWLPVNDGSFDYAASKTLPLNDEEDSVEMGALFTGRGTGAQIRWTDSDLEISKAAFLGMMRSRRLGVI